MKHRTIIPPPTPGRGSTKKRFQARVVYSLAAGTAATVAATPLLDGAEEKDPFSSLEDVVRAEMREWGIGGVAIALVDGDETVYASGFGEADRNSVFRVGSISKLFTATAVMQMVEKGKLDLDKPLPPDVTPLNPFPNHPAVTLRQLLSHRSGLQREPSVGHYLDPTEPSLAATVASVRGAVLVTRPTEKRRYSNLGPSIAGYLVERVSGLAFPDYQQERILDIVAMENSWWNRADVPEGRLITSHMRVAGATGGSWSRRDAPVFDLGTLPAGNLFSTVDDLARFASALMAGGAGLVGAETLAEMWRPQFSDPGTNDFGLGFFVGNFGDHRSVSHSGAVYGHSTSLVALPDVKVAAVVLANEDIASGRVRRISEAALAALLQRKLGEAPPAQPPPFAGGDVAGFSGQFESQSYWADLSLGAGRLVGNLSGQHTVFHRTGPLTFAVESRILHGATVTFERGGEDGSQVDSFTIGAQQYHRVPDEPPPGLRPRWRRYLGTYGHGFIPLLVGEKHGHLYVMTENMVDYRLAPVNQHVCTLPPGMYVDEEVVFLTDEDGSCNRINFANMLFHRRGGRSDQ